MAGYVLSPKAVRALIPLVRGSSNAVGASAGGAGSISYDDYPLPFAVSWSDTASNWVVWLPDLSKLVYVDSTAITITGGSAAQNLPSGYYTVSGLSSSSTALYLNITIPNPGQTGVTTTAALSASAASSSTGNTVYPLTVATMATDANTGAKTVKQCLTSVVVVGGASQGSQPPYPIGTTVDFVGEIQYDVAYHQLQQRVDTLDLATGQVTQGQWAMITGGQAVAHSTVV